MSKTVRRDVKVEVEGLPIWAVAALFDRIHKECGKPDVKDVEATLVIHYTGMSEKQYEALKSLQDELWQPMWLEVKRTAAYIDGEKVEVADSRDP